MQPYQWLRRAIVSCSEFPTTSLLSSQWRLVFTGQVHTLCPILRSKKTWPRSHGITSCPHDPILQLVYWVIFHFLLTSRTDLGGRSRRPNNGYPQGYRVRHCGQWDRVRCCMKENVLVGARVCPGDIIASSRFIGRTGQPSTLKNTCVLFQLTIEPFIPRVWTAPSHVRQFLILHAEKTFFR